MFQNFSKIWIVVVVAVFAVAGIFYWQYWQASEKKVEEIKMPEGKALIEIKESAVEKPELNLDTTKLATIPRDYEYFGNSDCIKQECSEHKCWCISCNYCFSDVLFNPSGKHVVYWKRNKSTQSESIVMDNKKDNIYSCIDNLTMSPDGESFAYIVGCGDGRHVVIDSPKEKSYEEKTYKRIWGPLIFSFDSKHIAYWAFEEKRLEQEWFRKWFMIFDNKKSSNFYDGYYDTDIVFSPDSNHLAYKAVRGEKRFVVLDDKEGPAYEQIRNLIFSSDSQHIGYYALKAEKWFLVIDNKEISNIESPYNTKLLKEKLGYFPSEEKKPVVSVFEENNKFFIVFNGYKGKGYDRIYTTPVFASDGKRICYGAQIDNELWWIVDEVE